MGKKEAKLTNSSDVIKGYAKNIWWIMMGASILFVILGIYALFFPGATMEFFITLFGAILIACGVLGAIMAFVSDKRGSGLSLAISAIAFVVGVLVIQHPVGFTELLVYLIAIMILIKSLISLKIVNGTKNGTEVWFIASGVLGIIASIFLFMSPVIGGIAILIVLGIYAIVFGVMAIIDLISVRKKYSQFINK